MQEGYPTWWKIFGGCVLATAGATVVVCVRLVMATPAPSTGTPTPDVTNSRPRQISPATKVDIESLLATGREADLSRWMENGPAK